jgi:hypothetical protein
MKTKTYILTMLVLIIHVVVVSQPANQAFQHDKNFVLGYSNYTEEERKEFSTIDDPSVLLIQADDLVSQATKAKKEAYFENGKVKTRLTDEKELLHEADTKKLAAAELTAYNNRVEFKLMKESLIGSLHYYDAKDPVIIHAKDLLLKSVRYFKSAEQLREEAYAQQTTGAIIGNLHNAEELENNSIIQIGEAMMLLEKVLPNDVGAN